MTSNIRPIRIEGNVAFITLTMGYESVIDADDVTMVSDRNWSALVRRKKDGEVRTVYAISNKTVGAGKQKMIFMHRVLLGPPDGMHCDHIDGDGLNNRRANIRAATPSQNHCNQRTAYNSESGTKGVFRHKGRRKWQAAITKNGKRFYLGSFDTKEAAAAAYSSASAKLHGQFGRTA